MRPDVDNDAVTVAEFAEIAGVDPRTIRRWIASWIDQGVDGIRLEPSRGNEGGARYVVERTTLNRWLDCQLPNPNGPSGEPLAPKAGHTP